MNMHSALTNFDIISLILRHSDVPDGYAPHVGQLSLARAARVCVAFYEPAIRLLWRCLSNIVPLLSLLPSSLMKVREDEEDKEGKYDTYMHRARRVRVYAKASGVRAIFGL
ncbi:hypothetical protein BD310DRAFT_927928 [Dichomitus squalens]|uniref:Uncharacterized protein n=1 Tax=Dichomitus squalens TaxID=114155 RepID=A0A4Q9PU94_9APHY|nr:hypothetical protein BD310DRAFT_927928 [Dichomitus squalens]